MPGLTQHLGSIGESDGRNHPAIIKSYSIEYHDMEPEGGHVCVLVSRFQVRHCHSRKNATSGVISGCG